MLAVLLLSLAGQSDTALPSSSEPVPLWTATETCVAAGTVVAAGSLLLVDRPVDRWATEHHTFASRNGAAGAKLFGDGYTVPIAGALWWAGADGRAPRLARASRDGLESWILTEAIVQVGKYGVHRHRPSESSSPYVVDGPSISSEHVSFPSGHSASAWGLLPAYALEYSDHPWLAGAIYLVAASTSLSRVHDGMHWSSDVAFSAGLGWIVNRVVRSWNLRREGGPALQPVVGEHQGLQMVWEL
jgi:hypothetical protein